MSSTRRLILLTSAVSMLAAVPPYGWAQAPQDQRVQLDVASVKRSSTDLGPRGISFSPSGRFAWTRMTLKQLMQSAFGGVDFKVIVGGPRWVESERFDIVATSPDALRDIAPNGAPRGLFLRLRALLEDRFQLKTYVENRSVAVFVLQPARSPMVFGPSLHAMAIDCEAVIKEMAGGKSTPAPAGTMPLCSMRQSVGELSGHAITMGQVADALSAVAGRPVLDHTGLEGNFDVELKWAPDAPAAGILLNGAPAPPFEGPSIFTAVREQLGVKLEPGRADVPVLVIDDVQMPGPD